MVLPIKITPMICFAIFINPLIGWGDVITLKSGRALEGQITEVTDSGVTFNTQDNNYTMRYAQIQEIQPSANGGVNSEHIEQAKSYLDQLKAKGQAQYASNATPTKRNQKIEIYIASGKPAAGGQANQSPAQAWSANKNIEIYTTNWCPACKAMRAYLNKLGVRYRDYDIDRDKRARRKYKEEYGAPGIPVLVVDGKFISAGFSQPQVDTALK